MHMISILRSRLGSDWPSRSRSLSGASHVPISIFFSVSANRKPINNRVGVRVEPKLLLRHPSFIPSRKNYKYSSYTRYIREIERKLANHTEKGTGHVQCHSDQTVHFS